MEAEESNGAPRDVLLIDCKQDVDRAYDLALTIWTKLFRLSPDNWYDRKIQDISFQDELIDSPDHPNLWPEAADGINYDFVKQLLRDTVALSPADVFFLSGLTLLAHISLIGLPAATLLSVSEPHDWTLVLGGITLGGSTASLVFFLIYVFAFLMLRGFLDDKKKFKKAMANKQTSRAGLYYPLRRFVTIMLPIAVILIWAGA